MPSRALGRLQGKTVRLSRWRTGELTDEQREIIEQAYFIGKVMRVESGQPGELRVKFGNGQHGHACCLRLKRSQVDLIE